MYCFKYSISEQEYLDLNLNFTYHNHSIKIIILIVFLPIVVLYAFSLVNYMIAAEGISMLVIGIMKHVVPFAALFVFGKITIIPIYKLHIRYLKKSGGYSYDKDRGLSFDDDLITQITEDSISKIKYRKIKNIIAVKDAVYVFDTTVTALIVPFRVFDSEEQINSFLAFISQKSGVKLMDQRLPVR